MSAGTVTFEPKIPLISKYNLRYDPKIHKEILENIETPGSNKDIINSIEFTKILIQEKFKYFDEDLVICMKTLFSQINKMILAIQDRKNLAAEKSNLEKMDFIFAALKVIEQKLKMKVRDAKLKQQISQNSAKNEKTEVIVVDKIKAPTSL